MLHAFSRLEMVVGSLGFERLKRAKVAIFGVGGVGSFAAEALARSGVGHFILCDDDAICLTNINRQIHAGRKTVGQMKVEVMKERILDINPKAVVEVHPYLYNAQTADQILPGHCDYVVDAIDMVSAKIDLIMRCHERGIPIISAMGTGNKLQPQKLEVTDIYNTSVCPLARVMRKELRRRGLPGLSVVYSKEEPIEPHPIAGDCNTHCICPKKDRTCVERRSIPGSTAFVPSAAGLIMASEIVRAIIQRPSKDEVFDLA